MSNLQRRNIRRWLWTGGLSLTVSWGGSAALGQEVTWRSVPAAAPAGAASPVPVNPAVIAVTPTARPAASLGRPTVALDRPVPLAPAGDSVRPVTFTAVADGAPAPVFRAQKSDAPKPAAGPDLGGQAAPAKPQDMLGQPRLVPTPTAPAGAAPVPAGAPAAFPPGTVLHGTGPLPPGAIPPGAIPPGAIPPGAVLHGTVPPGVIVSDSAAGLPAGVIAGTPVMVAPGTTVDGCGPVVVDPCPPCPAGSVICNPFPTGGVLACPSVCPDPFEVNPFDDPDGCCNGSDHRFWVSGEFLAWWIKGATPPPLLVGAGTMPAPGGGMTINPNSIQTLYGDRYIPDETRTGGRFAAGWWFDDCHHLGIDGGFFFLGSRGLNYTAGDTGQPGTRVLGRPFIDATTGQPGVQIVAAPPNLLELPDAQSGVQGTFSSSLVNRLIGADVNLRTNLWNCCWSEGDLLGGFRYLGFNETLTLRENLTVLGTSPTNFVVTDQFKVKNNFYGPQVGLDMRFLKGPWSLGVWSKVAVGNMNRSVNIAGSTAVTTNGSTQTLNGGLLALPSNIGRYSDNSIAVIPEVGLNVGYQLTEGLRLFVGYNFLYASNVFRATDQVNLAIDPNQVPRFGGTAGGSAPRWTPRESGLWAHGVSLGLEWRY